MVSLWMDHGLIVSPILGVRVLQAGAQDTNKKIMADAQWCMIID